MAATPSKCSAFQRDQFPHGSHGTCFRGSGRRFNFNVPRPGVPGTPQTFTNVVPFSGGDENDFSAAIFGSGAGEGIGQWDFIHFNEASTIGPPPPPATDFTWSASGTGIWTNDSSWTSNPDGHPNSPNHAATFGDLIDGPTAAVTHDPVTVNRIQFTNSTNSYAISGLGSVQLSATTAPSPVGPSMSVAGSHQFQVPVNLAANTDVDVASDSTLTFNNALNLNGNTLIKVGMGTLNVNNVLAGGGGDLNCQEGTCGGNGTVAGNLDNIGGTISPGNSVGVGGGQVPEPTSVVLLGLGGLLLFWLRASRRRE